MKNSTRANRSGQVTIFIIIAILIVVAIIAFFFLFRRMSSEDVGTENPRLFIDKCVKDALKESVDFVLAGGGRIEPDFFVMYNGMKHNYLCYQRNYYLTCINHYPQLKKIIEDEIKEDTEDDVRKCFADLRSDLERKGFVFSEGDLNYSIELVTGKVLIKIEKRVDISKEGSQSFEDFDSNFVSPVYDLAMVAREIVNQESQYCNFEYNGFMLLYPEYDIKRIDYDDNKIYKLTDRNSGKEFKFAVRSCAFPPGI